MKLRLIAASIGIAACTATFAADHSMTSPERTSDMRAKCEQLTGNSRMTCMDQVNEREKKAGAGAMGPSQSTKDANRATGTQKRAEGHNAATAPRQNCATLTGDARLACEDKKTDAQ